MGNVAVGRIWKTAESEMKEAGRCEKTIENYHHLFENLEYRCPGGIYSPSVGMEFAKPGAYSPRYGRMRSRVVEIAERYASGNLPCTGKPIGGKSMMPRSEEFVSLLEELDGFADGRGLAAKTKSDYRYMASLYLVYLEGNGMMSLREAKASTVAGFISYLSGAGSKSPKSLVVSHLRPLFFCTRGGVRHALSTDAVSLVLKNAGDAARTSCPLMPALHCHLIRKTRAMDLYQAGVPLPLVAQFLGHENVSTTSGFYAFATAGMLEDAVRAAAPTVLMGEARLNKACMEKLFSLK